MFSDADLSVSPSMKGHPMDMVRVNSRAITAVGYDPATNRM
jgi:hypothetical protein